MGLFDISIQLDMPEPLPPGAPVNEQTFPMLAAAVNAVTQEGYRRWRGYLSGVPLPTGRAIQPRTGAAARSLQIESTGPFSSRVWSDSPIVNALEHGTGARDMKRALGTSAKVRLTAKGKRYLIIPFRHGTPGTVSFSSVMPQHIHELAKAMRASRVTSTRAVPNVIGLHDAGTRKPVMIQRRRYRWGDRLPAGLSSKLKPHHKTDQHAGMVRFDSPQGRHSHYLTFRTMHEDSKGWIRPAMPGYHAAQAVTDALRPQAEQLFREAFEADVRALLTGAGP
jgi:hypothetical protein